MSEFYAVTIVVEAEGKEEARRFAETFGAGPGQQWDKPLTICGPTIVFETVDPASYVAPDVAPSTHNGFPTEDSAALDNLAKYLNDQDSWSGADACEIFAEALQATGRAID